MPKIKILIIRFSSLGDTILTTPVVRATRVAFPNSEIHFLTKSYYASIFENNPNVDRIISFNGEDLGGLIEQLKAEKYDYCFDLHNSVRSRQIRAKLINSKITVFPKNYLERWLYVGLGLKTFEGKPSVIERYFEGLDKYGLKYDGNGTEFFIDEKIILDLPIHQPYIVVCPGASATNKIWPLHHYITLSRLLAEQLPDYRLVWHGGNAEQKLCDKLVAEVGGLNYAGKLDLKQGAVLLKSASAIITADSGLLHLAEAVKQPVIALFGPTTKQLGYFPHHPKSIVLEVELACRPCTRSGLNYCPLGHHYCLSLIEPTTVLQQIIKILPQNAHHTYTV